MLDCRDYESEIDRKIERDESRSFDLKGLRHELVSRFLGQIRVSTDGKPWIAISRNLVHYDMSRLRKKITDRSKFFVDEQAHLIENSRVIELGPRPLGVSPRSQSGQALPQAGMPDEFLSKLGKPYPLLSTNTKSQVIYCTLVDSEKFVFEHLVLHYSFNQGRGLLYNILDKMRLNGINIVRSQLRLGALGIDAEDRRENQLTDDDIKKINSWGGVFTLNALVLSQSRGEILDFLKFEVLNEEVAGGQVVLSRLPVRRPRVHRKDKLDEFPFNVKSFETRSQAKKTAMERENTQALLEGRTEKLEKRYSNFLEPTSPDLPMPGHSKAVRRLLDDLGRDCPRIQELREKKKLDADRSRVRNIFLSQVFGKDHTPNIRASFDTVVRNVGHIPLRGDAEWHFGGQTNNIYGMTLGRMAKCDAFVFFWTAGNADDDDLSDWMVMEVGYAIGSGKPIEHIVQEQFREKVGKLVGNLAFIPFDGDLREEEACRRVLASAVNRLSGHLTVEAS